MQGTKLEISIFSFVRKSVFDVPLILTELKTSMALSWTSEAPEPDQKSLSVNTVQLANHKCRLNLYHAKKQPQMSKIQKGCLKLENYSVVQQIKI